MGEQTNNYREEYYKKILDEAGQIIEGVAESIQLTTLEQYKKVVKRLCLAKQTPIQAAKTKGTYYAYRAAWIGYHANYIREKLSILESIHHLDRIRWRREIKELQYFIEQLKVCQPDPKRQQRKIAIEYDDAKKAGYKIKFSYSNEWREKSETEKLKKESRSKKHRTGQLPKEWREKLFKAAINKHSKHTLAIAIMICTGCRPKELENGIRMTLDKKSNLINFSVVSAKRKNEKTELRQFTIKNDSLAFKYLVSQLWFNDGLLEICDMNYKAASTEVGRLSEAALNLKKDQASPYCFRHAFSGDLHAAKINREDIAKCLGHSTDATQAYYSSSSKHSSGAFKIGNINSTESVKGLTEDRISSLLKALDERKNENIIPKHS